MYRKFTTSSNFKDFFEKPIFLKKTKFWNFREISLFQSHSTENLLRMGIFKKIKIFWRNPPVFLGKSKFWTIREISLLQSILRQFRYNLMKKFSFRHLNNRFWFVHSGKIGKHRLKNNAPIWEQDFAFHIFNMEQNINNTIQSIRSCSVRYKAENTLNNLALFILDCVCWWFFLLQLPQFQKLLV